MEHVSVLLNECIENLNIVPDGIYLDGTLGRGGHSEKIAEKLTSGRLIAIDRDSEAIKEAGKRLERFGDKVTLVKGNFEHTAHSYLPEHQTHNSAADQNDALIYPNNQRCAANPPP